MLIRSPLRYPGGKSRSTKYILPYFPHYVEYREPFVGGGSVFIQSRQQHPGYYWINDKNEQLMAFWKMARDHNHELTQNIQAIYDKTTNGKSLYKQLKASEPQTQMDMAVRFFILNRITFSGTTDSGGYSEHNFHHRFTQSSIHRVSLLQQVLPLIKMTSVDYEALIQHPGQDVLIYLDPPYYSAQPSRLYGTSGHLHHGFDYERLAQLLKDTPHQWVMTIDNHPYIQDLFSFAKQKPFNISYSMTQTIGSELIVWSV